jgi:hypothetical protein
VHLRRALLLFAIVLGLAALATSVSRPSRDDSAERRSEPPVTSEASPLTEPPGLAEPAELRLRGRRGKARARLESGQAGTFVVPVQEPGEVEVPDLGLTAAGTPLTPARFELLVDRPGSYLVYFTPAGADEARTLGRLVVD